MAGIGGDRGQKQKSDKLWGLAFLFFHYIHLGEDPKLWIWCTFWNLSLAQDVNPFFFNQKNRISLGEKNYDAVWKLKLHICNLIKLSNQTRGEQLLCNFGSVFIWESGISQPDVFPEVTNWHIPQVMFQANPTPQVQKNLEESST